jgi:hypothetical protein
MGGNGKKWLSKELHCLNDKVEELQARQDHDSQTRSGYPCTIRREKDSTAPFSAN